MCYILKLDLYVKILVVHMFYFLYFYIFWILEFFEDFILWPCHIKIKYTIRFSFGMYFNKCRCTLSNLT